MTDAKRALRTEMRALRAAIATDPADRLRRSAHIWARIVSIADLGADRPGFRDGSRPERRVMLFEGLPTEPATDAWFAWCRGHDVEVYAPEVDGPDLRVVPGDVNPADLDVVVVPGLAFTADGRRLGQGGGHYDRFLPRLRADCVTIGACFAEQVVGDLPTDAHDVRVRYIASA